MSNVAPLGAVEYESETSAALWGEDVVTFTNRVACLGEPNVSGLTWTKEAANHMEEYRGGGAPPVLMTQGGSFTTTHDLVRGATMVGSPTISAFGTLWGIAVGNVALSAAASTTLTGGTAAVPITTASGTLSAGGLVRVGALGDGDGNGQMYAIGTHTATNLTLLGEMDGAPVNGAVVYPVEQVYPSSSAVNADIVGTRFRFLSANLGYECHGCYPMSIAYSNLNTGGRPQAVITWGVSWWRYTVSTLPSAVAAAFFNPAPVAAGSFNLAAVGTTTRTKYAIRNFSITHDLGVVAQMAPGGVNAYQVTTGAKRGGATKTTLSFTVDANAASATPAWHTIATGIGTYHLEYTMSANDSTALGLKCPKVCITNVPTQTNVDGINRLNIEAEAYVGATITNDLTRAPIVWGIA